MLHSVQKAALSLTRARDMGTDSARLLLIPQSVNPSAACARRDRQLKQNFQWTMVALTAATGGVYVLQGAKERFGFEQRLINCAIAFWHVPGLAR